LTGRQIFTSWWPLAASWLLMGTEMSMVSAVIARLPDADYHLAAFGGVVFPMALLIEAPIIMMLAASTALSVDRDAFARLKRFSIVSGVSLSVLHAVIAFTPLYDLIIVPLIGPPPEAIEPGRIGMCWMVLWTWAIADRRFHQGLLIRFERSRAVVVGTMVRLVAMGAVLVGALVHGSLPGTAVAGCALSAGVVAEMVTARMFAAPVISGPLAEAPLGEPLTMRRLMAFYAPLAVTPILSLVALPIGSASIARMPMPLSNLAAWPPVNGLIFMSRSVGIAFNEVVVSLSGRPGARPALTRFALQLALVTSALLALVAFTPMSDVWFSSVSGLDPALLEVARASLPFGILMPGLTVLVSLYTGFLVQAHRTSAIPESVGLCLVVTVAVLFAGVLFGVFPGVQVTLVALSLGAVVQCLWLGLRHRGASGQAAR
jgi:hypothetical protein